MGLLQVRSYSFMSTRLMTVGSLPYISQKCDRTQHENFRITQYNPIIGSITLFGYTFILTQASHAVNMCHEHEAYVLFAQQEDFWPNMVRYARYFITVMLGTVYIMLKPVFELVKNPVSVAIALFGIAGIIFAIFSVLTLMLGISDAGLRN